MNKILEMKFGSHLYGTETPNSDLDIKGIYLPTAREIVLHSYKPTIQTHRNKAQGERNTKDDTDTEHFSLDRFLELLTDGQTVALDLLFGYAQSFTHLTPQGTYTMFQIFNNRHRLLTKNVNAFVGYARQQAAKYGIKGSRMDALKRTKEYLETCDNHLLTLNHYGAHLQNLIDECSDLVSLEKTALVETVLLKGANGISDQPHLRVNGRAIPYHAKVKYALDVVGKMLDGYGQRAHKAHLAGGVDWKALSHAVRVNTEALELLETGNITFPRPDKELLVKIKTGQLVYEQVAEIIEEGLANLYAASSKSTLRDAPDVEWVNDFVTKIYTDIVRNG